MKMYEHLIAALTQCGFTVVPKGFHYGTFKIAVNRNLMIWVEPNNSCIVNETWKSVYNRYDRVVEEVKKVQAANMPVTRLDWIEHWAETLEPYLRDTVTPDSVTRILSWAGYTYGKTAMRPYTNVTAFRVCSHENEYQACVYAFRDATWLVESGFLGRNLPIECLFGLAFPPGTKKLIKPKRARKVKADETLSRVPLQHWQV